MQLTHKAIARAAGYLVIDSERTFSPFKWLDKFGGEHGSDWHDTEEEAYKACCEQCGLIDKNEE